FMHKPPLTSAAPVGSGPHLHARRVSDGRSETQDLAVAAQHAPLAPRAGRQLLRRGQGDRRAEAAAPRRPEDRHVQGPPGPDPEGRLAAPPRPNAGPSPYWSRRSPPAAGVADSGGMRWRRTPKELKNP